MRAARSRFVLSVLLALGVVGCEVIAGLEDHQFVATASAPDGSSIDGNATSSEASSTSGLGISVSAAELTALPAATANVTVTITRSDGFAGAVDVTVAGLPSTVTATNPLQIASNQTTATLTFTVATGAAQSTSHLSIEAASVDGKISATTQMDFLVRGEPGTLDLTFGDAGLFTSTALTYEGAAIDSTDGLFISGVVGSNFGAFRISKDGAVDKGFATINQPFAEQAVNFSGVCPLASTDVLFAGQAKTDGELVRTTDAGAIDPTYSADGGIGYADTSVVTVFACDSAGRLFAGAQESSATDFFLERRTTTGARDPAFNAQLHVLQAGYGVFPQQMIVQVDNRILVLWVDSMNGLRLTRILASGNGLDTGFGANGMSPGTEFLEGSDVFNGRMLLALDQSIYIMIGEQTSGIARIEHIDSVGNLDTNYMGIETYEADLALQKSDGKIVTAGTTQLSADAGYYTEMQVERFTVTGAVDKTFGTSGITVTDVGTPSLGGSAAKNIFIQSDGRILVTGVAAITATTNEIVVARYWP